ncbi:MAG: TlpA disulfide reductase family protein [Bacteroidota bacterium]
MRYGILIGSLLIRVSTLIGQPFVIQGNIQYADKGMIFLASYYGDRFQVTDSMESTTGSFIFLMSEKAPGGIYRLIYPEVYQGIMTRNRFVEFIYNREDVSMNISRGENGPVPFFENSLENRVYFEFMTFQLDYEAQLTETYRLLFPALPGDSVYESAVYRYQALQHNRYRFMDSISSLFPDLYATKIMNAFRAPVMAGSMTHAQRIHTLKQVFFDGNPIDDPELLHAPVYTFRIIDYLSLYRVDTLSMESQQEAFIEAVDQIMVHVAPLSELRSFMVGFLLEGYELLGMETVQVHLAENYLEESCESDVAGMVLSRIEGYKKMAVGSIAPDFIIRDIHGKNQRLSKLPNPYVLVFFWASTCEHCAAMIPGLRRWYLEENDLDLEVVAISIDSSAANFEKFVQEADMPWITSHDHLGWNGKVPGDYHIYATPSMFLLDREQKILARPVNMKSFRKAVRKLEPL